ncbi:human GRASP protein family Golgi protein [Schizosaccharomyces pombe]|uniref:Uncharacterized protein C1D4.02c n=1 Tax=Schizosaccharomyces pombe (strain 972 / ATCC 24843) TaxID=284812 RepID=YAT2_SCHPO|nr:putative GRASP family protein [Schizosaccharomyces pombe]Q10149.2 RecName: Full=Uncharacterized protein C1D4.02c [Schizosaccharomyces pombe 972h-]CAB56126.1 human GRASP protein family Golgi protein (predicted) [Schizosaccharomyces pombe]|eukprot:NP_593015.1 putative GRASP family protein [Schizosaccharomyces pombe]
MFGGLKNFIKEKSEALAGIHRESDESCGFRVLKVENDSKAYNARIESYYDFITAVNGILLNGDPSMFMALLRDSSPEVTLEVFSLKGQITRKVNIKINSDEKIGMVLQWASIAPAVDAIWHILNVIDDSPVARASLVPYEDYIVGTPEGMMTGEKALSDLIESHLNRPLRLYIYNHYRDSTRQVTIVPNRHWGGNGAIGCGVGHGVLHRLPAPLSGPPPQPGDIVFSNPMLGGPDHKVSQPSETENFLPTPEPPKIASANAGSSNEISIPHYQRHKKSHKGAIQDSSIQSYLDEEEKLSRELDHKTKDASSTNDSQTTPLPPPPPVAVNSTNDESAPQNEELVKN